MNDDELRAHVAPVFSRADIRATRHGGLAAIKPLSVRATIWLRENTGEDAIWENGELIVETRYFPDLADGLIGAGFLFEP